MRLISNWDYPYTPEVLYYLTVSPLQSQGVVVDRNTDRIGPVCCAGLVLVVVTLELKLQIAPEFGENKML